MTAIIERGTFSVAQDLGEAEPVPVVLMGEVAFGIQMPNAKLWREPHAHLMAPEGDQPTVWFTQEGAEIQRSLNAARLELWDGITPEELDRMRVVRLERDGQGQWNLPEVMPTEAAGYRPVDPETGKVAELPCASTIDLDLEQARSVVREHKPCAGQVTCKIRGRARAVLVRAGVWTLAYRNPNAWKSLDLPDMALPGLARW